MTAEAPWRFLRAAASGAGAALAITFAARLVAAVASQGEPAGALMLGAVGCAIALAGAAAVASAAGAVAAGAERWSRPLLRAAAWVGAGGALAACALDVTRYPGHYGPLVPALRFVVLTVAGDALQTVVHEAGHALAGAALGLGVRYVRAGPIVASRGERWRIRFAPRHGWWSGLTAYGAGAAGGRAVRALTSSSGPLANAAAMVVAIALLWRTPSAWLAALRDALLLGGATALLASVVPRRTALGWSDGAWFAAALVGRTPPAAPVEDRADVRALVEAAEGVGPDAWSVTSAELATCVQHHPWNAVAAALAVSRAMEEGNVARARRVLDLADDPDPERASDWDALLPLQRVLFDALVRGDWRRARTRLRALGARGSGAPSEWLAAAAVLACAGEAEGARSAMLHWLRDTTRPAAALERAVSDWALDHLAARLGRPRRRPRP